MEPNFELQFLWINNFNNIHKEGFAFCGKYFFEYNQKKRSIQITRNKAYQPDFFNSSKPKKNRGIVSTVTAIVGENGSGKSSLIQFFCNLLKANSSRKSIYQINDDVIIFENQDQLLIYTNNKVKKYRVPEIDSFLINLNKPDEEYVHGFDNSFMHFIITIFYSTDWTEQVTYQDAEKWELINVSNNYLYYHSHFPNIMNDDHRKINFRFIDHPGRHHSEDARRQLHFLNEHWDWLNEKFGLKSLENIGISVIQKFTWEKGFNDLFKLLFATFNPSNDAEFSQLMFSTCSIYSFVYTTNTNPQSNQIYIEDLKKCLKGKSLLNELKIFLNQHPNRVPPRKVKSFDGRTMIKMYDFKVPQTIQFLEFINQYFKPEYLTVESSPLANYRKNKLFNHFIYRFDYKFAYQFLELYLNHLDSNVTPDYIHFESLNYSGGEISLLNLFSRVPYTNDHVISNFHKYDRMRWTKTNKIVLLLDECEAFLHPQWQKKLFKHLLEFVARIFKNKSVQIIITTHSPILISDLPKHCIIYLQKVKETGKCKNVSSLQQNSPFASNIYNLYSDSFFINDGMIGDFSKDKIAEITNKLSKRGKLKKAEYSEIENTIELIGEPVWKQMLFNMLKEKRKA